MLVTGQTHYEKTTQIGVGQGQNSQVWLANDAQLGGVVAVKEIPKTNFGNDPKRFFEEAKAMFRSEHPNVVPIQYACDVGQHVSLVMRFFSRGSLLDRIKTQPLSIVEVRRVGQGILAGLAKIHAGGTIHFDIKPSNVLFADDGDRPMLADFGQARCMTANGAAKPLGLYDDAMPPETLPDGVGTVESDIFQVGLLLYRAANGEPVYKPQVPKVNLDSKILDGAFPDRQHFLPHVPARLRTIIRKALKVAPSQRYRTASDMSKTLGRANLGIDWHVSRHGNAGYEWRGNPDKNRAMIVVRLIDTAPQMYSVESFTRSVQGDRAREKATAWRKGLNYQDALAHLDELFAKES